MRTIKAFIVGAILILTVGCGCTKYVRNLGLKEVELRPNEVLIDKDKNVVIQAALVHAQKAPRRDIAVGRCYINASAETVRRVISESRSRGGDPKYPISIGSSHVKSDYAGQIDPKQNPIWYLTPADTRGNAPKSEQVSPLKREMASVYRVGDVIAYPDANGNPVNVRFQYFDVEPGNRQFRAGWGYPMQILTVPAFLVDVVTFPLQAFAFAASVASIRG